MTVKTEKNPEDAHRDRVAQVYFGMLKWGATGEILRQRIDWMADQAQGPRILDVGCSEGVLEILLAREGFNVTGVDINAEALAFARDLLAQEPEEVRARVRFLHGDLAQARLLDDRFDTLVMGELLEHLEDPQTLLNRSLDLIRPDGRVIITTPFGYHPDEDHRQTFCLSDFIALAKPRCALEYLQVEGGYIRMVGRVSSSTESSWKQLDSDQLLSMTETASVSSQQRLYGNISGHKRRVSSLEQRVKEGDDRAAKLQKDVKEESSKATRLWQEVEHRKAKASKLQQELKRAIETESKLRRSIRWQLGTLFVGAARRPWRVVRLPLDLTRLAVVAYRRRYSVSSNNVSTRNPSHPSPPMTKNRGNMREAQARPGGPTEVPTATSLLSAGSSSEQMVDWITDQVEGHRVAVVGCDNTALLESLDQLRFNVSVYQLDSSVSEPVLVKREVGVGSQEEPGRSLVTDFSIPEAERTVGLAGKGDSVIICGMLRDEAEAAAFLNCVRDRLSQPEAKVIIVQPRFNAFPRNGKDSNLTSLLTALRTSTVPEYLSFVNDSLRFVGRFGRPSAEVWSQFESEIWTQLMQDVVEALQGRQRREVDSLEQRIQVLLKSTAYQAGRVLVASAKEPRTLWKVPFRLWRLYDTSRARKPPRPVESSPSGATPTVSFPALMVPPPQSIKGPVVAVILDTFTEYCLRYEADLLLLTPKHWKRQMDRAQPAFLLVESAWSGNNGAWRYLITNYQDREVSPLRELLKYCREQGIRTVFWNKEDPADFDTFIDAAKEFDCIFTTDCECIPKYKKICGHDRIYVMPFASQPRLHNPSRQNSWPRHSVCFAGSWMEKFPERNKSLQYLLDPALPFGLHIFDRNFNLTGPDSSRYQFPQRYQNAIKGSLDYEHMLTAYRCYDVMMNVNSVTVSPTMFSRRVFEILACGTPVISTDSIGLREMLGSCVRITRCPEDTTSHLHELLNDEEARMREGHLGYRYVHEHHTYRHRMHEMFVKVGAKPKKPTRQPSVSVVIATCRPDNVEFAIANYAKQSYAEKELFLVLNNARFDVEFIKQQSRHLHNVHIMQIEGRPSLGECLNRGVGAASGDYIAKMDDDDHYGEKYLSDMMLAARFTEAEILGKGTFFVHMKGEHLMALRVVAPEHGYGKFVAGATLTMKRYVLKEIPFPERTIGEDSGLLKNASQAGCRIYSSDVFNFLNVRQADSRRHTWKIENAQYLEHCRNIRSSLEWQRVMI